MSPACRIRIPVSICLPTSWGGWGWARACNTGGRRSLPFRAGCAGGRLSRFRAAARGVQPGAAMADQGGAGVRLRRERMRAGNTRFVTEAALKPYFALPDGFVTHFGDGKFDSVYSGIYQVGDYKIGYLRLPDFE